MGFRRRSSSEITRNNESYLIIYGLFNWYFRNSLHTAERELVLMRCECPKEGIPFISDWSKTHLHWSSLHICLWWLSFTNYTARQYILRWMVLSGNWAAEAVQCVVVVYLLEWPSGRHLNIREGCGWDILYMVSMNSYLMLANYRPYHQPQV